MRILFITSNRLGDAVLSTGVLGYLLDRHPDARVTVAAGPVPAPLFRSVPGLERLIVLEKGPWLAHWRVLLGTAMTTSWHVVADMRGSATAWVLPTAHRMVFATRTGGSHRVEQMQAAFGLAAPPAPRVWTSAADEARAAALLPATGPVLALAPTANWAAKTWPADRFVDLLGRLTGQDGPLPDARVAVLAAPPERAAAASVLAAVPPGRLIDLAGTESLGVIAACLARAALFVGNDSGLMHLAAAAGAPTLGLFGPSRDENYHPWGPRAAWVRTALSYDELRRSPDFRPEPDESLMLGLPVEQVDAAARALLERG